MTEIEPEDAKAALRTLRAIHGLSQTELAERAGMDPKSVQRYENGRPIPVEILLQLSEAAGTPERTFFTFLLPAVRYLRFLARPDPGADPGARLSQRDLVENGAARAAEAAAMATRGAFLRAWAEIVQFALEQDRNAWRPKPEDRERALDLWRRLEPQSLEHREAFLRHGTDFHSWALAEKVADLAVETLETDPEEGLELADLAHRIAGFTPGTEAWKARVRAYTLAALACALRANGDDDEEAHGQVVSEAWRLWAVGEGAAELGPLSEEKFRAALGTAGLV